MIHFTTEKKISMIMEALQAIGCSVLSMEFEEGTLDMSIVVADDDYDDDWDDEDDDEGCPCFDPDEDDDDDELEHCIHCCPECGRCMIGLDGEDC